MNRFSQHRGLLAVPLVVILGIWAALTIQFQAELLPLFPQQLPSVRGLTEFQFGFGTQQELTVVLEGATGDEKARVETALRQLPSVASVTQPGADGWEAMAANMAWMLANLPPNQFAVLQEKLTDERVAARMEDVRSELAGALDPEGVAMLQVDPLGLLDWIITEFTVPLAKESFANRIPRDQDAGKTDLQHSTVTALLVQTREPLVRFRECEAFVDAARAAVMGALDGSDARVWLTGRAAFMAENSSQMRRDMFVMVGVAIALVSLAFWLFYRSTAALVSVIGVQLLACMVGLFVARISFGTLNVISIGFGAILLGVGMDYCILVYHFMAQERESFGPTNPHWRTLRRAIWLSAVTTAAAFGVLALSSFPGLQQLSVLISTGLLATAFFATELLPSILPRFQATAPAWIARASDTAAGALMRRRKAILWATTGLIVAAAACWPLWHTYTFYESDLNKLRPANSEAYAGVEKLSKAYGLERTFDLVATGHSTIETGDSLAKAAQALAAKPVLLMAADDYLGANRSTWRAGTAARLTKALRAAGFEENWGMHTVSVLRELDRWAEGSQAFERQRSTLANVIRKPDGSVAALGRFPLQDGATVSSSWAMISEIPEVAPVSWPLMTDDLSRTARAEASRLSLFVLVAVVVLCWWAHRSWKLVMLNLAGLGIAIVGLLALLRITGQSMTVMSLMSVPLLIGLIIDISLHLVLGLEEHDGDLRRTFRHMAAPVVLTGVCTMIGFGAPMLTAQPALQNFGMVMDMGILAAVTTGLVILPAMYGDVRRRPHYSRTLYQARIFEAASWVGRVGGRRVVRTIGGVMGLLYDITHPAAAATLQQNLAVLRVEPIDKAVSHRALRNYGRALGDYFLLGTRPRDQVMALCGHTQGLEYVQDVLAEGKGLVLVTVHLGLFEYGGLLLDRLDHSMTVLTLPEPSRALSKWRAAYRKRWGVETIEVGEGYFGSVEAVRELKRGNCVAMLADRPYDDNAVAVPFPNGTVPFSTGPVWLSLLSGSPIVAVSIVTDVDGRYRVVAQPPLRPHWMKEGRDATVAHFTRELGKQFQQVICEHPDQWYQFVPLSR